MTSTPKSDVHNVYPGPILVLAGPGTGKTHSLALRVKWLVEDQKVSSENITVITFTTEAALNMRHRLSDEEKRDVYMLPDTQPRQISTMHSLGLRIIVNNFDSLGLTEDFSVIDSDALKRLVFEDAAQLCGLARSMGLQAATVKQLGITPPKDHDLKSTTDKYSSILRACNAIDFDDQILKACELLKSSPALLAEYQTRATHLLVDEYQDINEAQFQLIRLLAGENGEGLYAVGDDDQSIYSFRGGSPDYVRHFKDHFGDKASILQMPLCRRCPRAVVKGATALVQKYNPERVPKAELSFLSPIDTPIQFLNSPTEAKEAEIIATKCSKVTPSHDVLIIVPQLNLAKPVLIWLRKRRVAYDCRAMVLDAGLTYLDILGDWLADRSAHFSLRQTVDHLIGTDNFAVPSKRSRKAEKISEREKYLAEVSSLWETVIEQKCSLYDSLKANANKSSFLTNILTLLEQVCTTYDVPPTNFLEPIGRILQPWAKPADMFQEISTWIYEVKGRGAAGKASVRVMSMQLAKGLEADYVFVVGLDENFFPKASLSSQQLAEASRLMFVSMTRARVELVLCHSRTRSAATTHTTNPYGLKPSPFVEAIPKELINQKYIPGGTK